MKTKSPIIGSLSVETTDGTFLAHYTEAGLAGLDFPNGKKHSDSDAPASIHQWHKLTISAVQNALDARKLGALPPLDLSAGTDFQRQVWRALMKIPCGQTKTYSGLAQSLRHPRAARAVGGACGANPIPLLIPCHRILAAGGKIGGFSGGLGWKRKLLGRELGEGMEFV